MSSNALVAITNVTKKYGKRIILDHVSLHIQEGECFIIRGSNGSGKSTLLRIMGGIIPVTSGQRTFKHNQVKIGYTPDHLTKLRMTSSEYLMHMGKISHMPRKELELRIKELHHFFHLEQSNQIKMTQFSKGMLQKVNLMQATLKAPDLLVLDEPFSGLDEQSINDLLHSLKKIKAKGTAIIAAVHNPLLASQLENRTFWIESGVLIETSTKSNNSTIVTVFELMCEMKQTEAIQLASQFPDITWQRNEQGVYQFTINKSSYHNFMLEIVQRGIEIISLQRKEIKE